MSHSWTPGRDAYIGLGRMYVDDERFTATYDAVAPGLAPYLRDAIAVYAESDLRQWCRARVAGRRRRPQRENVFVAGRSPAATR